jgi:putative DNA primase/helicase
MSQPFLDAAPALWAAGYSIIPIRKGEKGAFTSGWQNFGRALPPIEVQQDWLNAFPDFNLGMVLGQASGVVVLDIDTDDADVMGILKRTLPVTPWVRVGKKGEAWLYRWNPSLRTIRVDIEGRGRVYELLASGSQIVLPPSIHPDTKRPYVANRDLVGISRDEIPELPANVEEVLRNAFAKEGLIVKSAGSGGGRGGPIKVLDFISKGGRDTQMTSMAGLYAHGVMKGERSLVEAMKELTTWVEEKLQRVDGDPVDPAKARKKLAEFLLRDATGPRKVLLPANWDSGLSLDDKEALGLGLLGDDARKLTVDEIVDYINVEITRPGVAGDESQMAEVAREAARRVAANNDLDSIQEGRIIRYIWATTKIHIPEIKKQINDLRKGEIEGLSHQEIAMAAIKEMCLLGDNPIRFDQGNFWQWMGSHWELYDDHNITSYLGEHFSKYPVMRKYSDHVGALKAMRDNSEIRKPLKMTPLPGLNFANGFLTMDGELAAHDPDYGMTYTLPYNYDAGRANQCVRFFDLLARCWGHDADYEEKVLCLQEAFGLTLFGQAPEHQKAFMLHGVPHSGKSQILDVLQGIMPKGCVASVSPEKWGDTFLPAQMAGKLLNIAGEISATKMIDGDIAKVIIDGTSITVQRKNQQPFEVKMTAAQWFAGNHLPKTRDSSEGFSRRFVLFEFNKRFPRDHKSKVAKLGEEIAAEERCEVAAWAVEGYMRLKRNGYRMTIPPSAKKREAQMEEANNNVRLFLSATMQEGRMRLGEQAHKGLKVTSTPLFDLYRVYSLFCRGGIGATPVGVATFKQRLDELQEPMDFKLETINRIDMCQWLTVCEPK